MSEDKA